MFASSSKVLAAVVLAASLVACSSSEKKPAPAPAASGGACKCASTMKDCMCDHCTASEGSNVACPCGAPKAK